VLADLIDAPVKPMLGDVVLAAAVRQPLILMFSCASARR